MSNNNKHTDNPNGEKHSYSPTISLDEGLLNQKAVIAITAGIGFTIFLFFTCYFLWKKKKTEEGREVEMVEDQDPLINITAVRSNQHLPSPSPPVGRNTTEYTYEELEIATRNFAEENELGKGGFGSVYKGKLGDQEVAIKKLNLCGAQGEHEFNTEISILSGIHHRNVVGLIGHCTSGSERLIVYEFVSNKTLYHHLHGDNMPILDWTTRVKVAHGCAKVLSYLHNDCDPRVIHRDFKTANILLDESFDPKVSDYGLAKFFEDPKKAVSTGVGGTPGCVDPECHKKHQVTAKTDVFAFGVVLLELITGRTAIIEIDFVKETLWYWAKPLLKKLILEKNRDIKEKLLDPRLEENYNDEEFKKMAVCAAYCTAIPKNRPLMNLVLRSFERNMTADNLLMLMMQENLTLEENLTTEED